MTQGRGGARRASTRERHGGARLDRASRREALLEAAVVAIRREGADASMESIAAPGGGTKPILYRHFGDREGLVRAIAEHFSNGLFDELRATLRQEAEARDLLAATIDSFLAFVERDPEVYRFVVSQVRVGSGEGDLASFVRRVADEVTLVIGEQLRERGQDSGAAEPWAYGIVGMVHLAGDWWLERRTMPRPRLVAYLTALLWDGLGTMSAAAAPPDQPDAQSRSSSAWR